MNIEHLSVLLLLFFNFNYFTSQIIPPLDVNNDGNDDIAAVDSDYLMLYRAASTLPVLNIGYGVFAKSDISKDSLICEYRGPVIAQKDVDRYHKSTNNDKLFNVEGPDGKSYHILGENICAYINDCTSIMNKSYTSAEVAFLDSLDKGDKSMQSGAVCYAGHAYNAAALTHWQTGNNFFLS